MASCVLVIFGSFKRLVFPLASLVPARVPYLGLGGHLHHQNSSLTSGRTVNGIIRGRHFVKIGLGTEVSLSTLTFPLLLKLSSTVGMRTPLAGVNYEVHAFLKPEIHPAMGKLSWRKSASSDPRLWIQKGLSTDGIPKGTLSGIRVRLRLKNEDHGKPAGRR